MKEKNTNKKGFTLMELLTVVVIIGVLSSIALPMYKKAVEKSKASDALTTMQAVAKSEHNWYLANNNYTKDFSNLDIELAGEIDDGILETTHYNYELLDKGILASRTNGEYSLYKDYEISQIMCSPSEHYICENFGKLTKEPCKKLGMGWSNSNSTCYASPEKMCKELHGSSMWHSSYCGYYNQDNMTLEDGLDCQGNRAGVCRNSTITAGGICTGNTVSSCSNSYIYEDGICKGNIGWSCTESKIYSGGVCEGKDSNACNSSTIYSGGVCEGDANGSCRSVTINTGGVCNANVDGIYNASPCMNANIESGGTCNANALYGCSSAIINNGGVCNAIGVDGCLAVTINAGGTCNAQNEWACNLATVNSGAVCKGTTKNSCVGATIKEGGECWANAEGACSSGWPSWWSWSRPVHYEGTGATSGCCRGTYCPSYAPRCECTNHEKMDSSGNCITA